MNARKIVQALRPDYLAHPRLMHEQIAIFVVGSLFWVEARLQGEAFSAQVFGDFALRFPAEFWAMLMMASSTLVWAGLLNPVKRWMVAVGSALQVMNFLALGYSALATGGEAVIGFWCTIYFAPAFARMFWEAVHRDAE
jgi:hypothetical protein